MIVYFKPGLIFAVGRRNGERRANRQRKRNKMNRCLEYEDWSLNLITEFKSYVCKYYFLKIFFWIKIATLAQIVSVSSNTLESSIWYLIKTSFVEEVQLPWWWYLVIKKLTMLVWSRVSVHDHTTVCRYLSQYKIMSNMSGSLIFF